MHCFFSPPSRFFSIPSTFYCLVRVLLRHKVRLLLTCASLRRPLPCPPLPNPSTPPSCLRNKPDTLLAVGGGRGGCANAKGEKAKEEGQERAGGGSSSEAGSRGNSDILKFHPWNTSSMFLPFHHITRTHHAGLQRHVLRAAGDGSACTFAFFAAFYFFLLLLVVFPPCSSDGDACFVSEERKALPGCSCLSKNDGFVLRIFFNGRTH